MTTPTLPVAKSSWLKRHRHSMLAGLVMLTVTVVGSGTATACMVGL